MLHQIVSYLLRFRWPILVFLAVTTPVAIGVGLHIGFNFTPQALFAGNQELIDYSEQFKDAFAHEDSVILIVLEATGPNDVLEKDALRWQNAVASRLAARPDIVRVESIPNMRIARIGVRGVSFRPLLRKQKGNGNRLRIDEEEVARIRAIVDRQDLVQGTLISRDRRCAVVAAFITPEYQELIEFRPVVEAANAIRRQVPCPDGYRSHITGLPFVRTDIIKNLRGDQVIQLPLSTFAFFIMICWTFRCLSGVVLPGISVLIGLAWTFAALVVLRQELNVVSNVLPTLLLVVGVSNCVHVMSRFAEEASQSSDRFVVTHKTIEHMALACLLTSLTTAIGFLSLLVAQSDVLRNFGWQAAMGMGCFYVATILVCGALMPSFRAPRLPRHDGESGESWSVRLVAAASSLAVRRPYVTASISLLLVAGAFWSARHVIIDSYIIETYDQDHPTIQTMRLVEEKLGGFVPLELSLAAVQPGRLGEPAVLSKVIAFQDYALARDEIRSTLSYADYYRSIDRQSPGTKRLQSPQMSDDEATRRRIVKIEETLNQFGPRINYSGFMTDGGRRGRVLMKIHDIGTHQSLILIKDLEQKLQELFPPGSGIEARVTGDAYVAAIAMDGFIRDLFYSLLGASLAIFAVLGLLFRSLRAGLISILPNLTPLVITLGYMGLRGYQMNASNVIVFAISLGIAVDDTIHFLARFREEYHRDGDVVAAIHRAALGAGHAIILTSILIVCGLAILFTSSFVPTRRFAELTSVTMLAALLGDLLLLPACLSLFWKNNSEAPTTATGH